MADNQIKIEISAGTEELVKALQSADKAAVKFSANMVSSIAPIETAAKKASNGITDGFKDAFSSLGKGVAIGNLVSTGILGVAGAIKDFVTGSVAAAEEQEKALNRLGQALRTTGEYSAEAVADFSAFASAMQANSVYGDEVVLSQLAIAKSFGATNEQAKQLVQAAANLAATMGGTLDERVQQLGKTFTGSAGRLSQLIPGFKSLTEEQLKAGAAAEYINNRFGGAAANELNTYSGKVTSLTNALSDLQEELGAKVTGSDFFKDVVQVGTGLLQELTQKMADSRIEADRQKEGFVETSGSIDQLQRKYNDLKVQLIDYEQVVLRNKDAGFLDSLFTTDNVPLAMERIKLLTPELKKIEDQLTRAKEEAAKAKAEAEAANAASGNKPGAGSTKTKEDLDKEKAAYEKLVSDRREAYGQLEIAQATHNANQIEQSVAAQEITAENYAFELQRLQDAEAMKIEAIYAAEEAKAAVIADAQTRQYTQAKIAADKEAALNKATADNKAKLDRAMLAQEQIKRDAMIGIMGSSFQLAAALAKDGSKEQFLIQKAAALAEIAVARGKAIAMIPAQTAHIPFPADVPAKAQLLAYANIQAALGAATVAATALKGFSTGGIVGGNSTSGDTQIIRANSEEVILNRSQQAKLLNIANGSAGSGGSMVDELRDIVSELRNIPIVVQANGREIARLIRDEQRNGFEVY